MDKEHKEQYSQNRETKVSQSRERAQRRRALRSALEDIVTSESASNAQKLEAARLIVELNKGYY